MGGKVELRCLLAWKHQGHRRTQEANIQDNTMLLQKTPSISSSTSSQNTLTAKPVAPRVLVTRTRVIIGVLVLAGLLFLLSVDLSRVHLQFAGLRTSAFVAHGKTNESSSADQEPNNREVMKEPAIDEVGQNGTAEHGHGNFENESQARPGSGKTETESKVWEKHIDPKVISGEETHYVGITASFPTEDLDGVRDVPPWNYLYYLPLTVEAWTDLGVRVLLILVGSEKRWRSHPVTNLILEELESKYHGSDRPMSILFFDDKVTQTSNNHDVMLAQNLRMYASLILKKMLAQSYDEKRIWLTTTDADIFLVDGQGFVRTLPRNADVRVVMGSGCCGSVPNPKKNGTTMWMYPFVYTTMNVGNWIKVVFDGTTDLDVSGERILEDFAEVFGRKKAYHKVQAWDGEEWYMDQHFLSMKLHEYVNPTTNNSTRENGTQAVDFFTRPAGQVDRVDRGNWNWPADDGNNNKSALLKTVTDAHLMQGGFIRDRWKKMEPFFLDVLGKEKLGRFLKFREKFLKTFGLLKEL